jgi:hypothetical protein
VAISHGCQTAANPIICDCKTSLAGHAWTCRAVCLRIVDINDKTACRISISARNRWQTIADCDEYNEYEEHSIIIFSFNSNYFVFFALL